jgi:hypothetical protein
MFGMSWGPRLEYILRYAILALLDRPSTTMLDITRMLTDKKFRKETLEYCKDVSVLQFWKAEFGVWSEKQVNESVAPILNKVGAFTANPIIRNIVGQPKSSFNIRQIMDEGKILIVNLSKGLIGEDNAAILGAFLVTKIQLAAMSRSDIPDIDDRRPFYLYVDEFQNFATDSFATILSEARKYGLNLTVANQYISQMGETVRDAVFGNVGSIISFRVSADDAPILAKQFEPQFEPGDLLQIHNRHFIINMIINGEKTPAFSATTLSLPTPVIDHSSTIIEHSRRNYARNRHEVEQEIATVISSANDYMENVREQGSLGNHITPTEVFINRRKVSPNTAENKQPTFGLKDISNLYQQSKTNPPDDKPTPTKPAQTIANLNSGHSNSHNTNNGAPNPNYKPTGGQKTIQPNNNYSRRRPRRNNYSTKTEQTK